MWFTNLLMYHYEINQSFDLEECLQKDKLKSCPPHARFIYGWMPTLQDAMIHEISGCARFTLGKEERLLPKGVVKQILDERITELESQGNPVKRAQRAQMMEQLEFELLPKAFCHQKKLEALFDFNHQHLYINTASASQAQQVLSLLRKSIPGIQIQALAYPDHLSNLFNQWITMPHTVPAPFQLANDCILISPDNEKKQVNCKGYEFPAEEIQKALNQGMVVTELSLLWHDRIQFTLTHQFVLKRLKCLDYLVDSFHEIGDLDEPLAQADATLALLSGELRALIQDLQKLNFKTDANKMMDINETAAV